MATMWIEFLPDEDDPDGEPETAHKHGDPMHLLADLRSMLRKHGRDNIGHVMLCMHEKLCGVEDDDA